MTRPLVFFEIRGRDPQKLQEFYEAVFGWTFDNSAPGLRYIAPGVGGPEGVGGVMTGSDTPRIVIYVQVLDLVETLRKAEALGGAAVVQPLDVPGGPTIAQMADPEGNIIGLVKQ
jgi:hypothetical protein